MTDDPGGTEDEEEDEDEEVAGRWKRLGARQTAKLLGVIWLTEDRAATSVRKARNVWRASRCSSGRRRTAQRKASSRRPTGTTRKRQKKSFIPPHDPAGSQSFATLKDGDERLGQFVGHEGLRKFPEVLLDHVRHVVGLVLVKVHREVLRASIRIVGEEGRGGDIRRRPGLAGLLDPGDAGADARLAEETHLVQGRLAEVMQGGQDRMRERMTRPLDYDRQRNPKDVLV